MSDERQGQDEPTQENPKDPKTDSGSTDAAEAPAERDEQLADDDMPDAHVMVNKD